MSQTCEATVIKNSTVPEAESCTSAGARVLNLTRSCQLASNGIHTSIRQHKPTNTSNKRQGSDLYGSPSCSFNRAVMRYGFLSSENAQVDRRNLGILASEKLQLTGLSSGSNKGVGLIVNLPPPCTAGNTQKVSKTSSPS